MNAVDVAPALPAAHRRVHAGICPHSSSISSGQCSGGGEAGRHPRGSRTIDIRFDLEDWRMRLIVLTVVALVLLPKNITPFSPAAVNHTFLISTAAAATARALSRLLGLLLHLRRRRGRC